MSEKELSRRTFLARASALGLVAVGSGALLSACGGGGGDGSGAAEAPAAQPEAPEAPAAAADPCSDLSGLSDADLQMRSTLQYVDETADPEKFCDNCQLWKAPEGGAACGGCQIIKGPIAPKGYCTSWAARVS